MAAISKTLTRYGLILVWGNGNSAGPAALDRVTLAGVAAANDIADIVADRWDRHTTISIARRAAAQCTCARARLRIERHVGQASPCSWTHSSNSSPRRCPFSRIRCA